MGQNMQIVNKTTYYCGYFIILISPGIYKLNLQKHLLNSAKGINIIITILQIGIKVS